MSVLFMAFIGCTRRLRAGAACAGALLCVIGPESQAQAMKRVAEGRVRRAAEDGRPVPVPGLWVVMHRVGTDHSAPLDSVRTDRAGRYRIPFTVSGDPDALYFVSARYDGITYFSPPARGSERRSGDGDVMVYSTTKDTALIRVQGRHFVVSAPRGDRREVAEVFELENGSFRTVVAPDSTTPVWHTMLAARAESASVAPGDLGGAAVLFRGGRAELYAPISPGVRQLVLTYKLPTDAFPLALPMTRPVSVLEVLLEEPRAVVTGAGLAEVEPATIDGRSFRRFLAQNVAPSMVMRVTAPAPVEQHQGMMRALAAVVAVSMIVALFAWVRWRGGRLRFAPAGTHVAAADTLIAELATLDARFDQARATAEDRAAYEARRREMKDRIARALAGEKQPG